jgi:urease accessory protein
MKLNINADFTSLPRAGKVLLSHVAGARQPVDTIALPHDDRHVRRKVLRTGAGAQVFVDLAAPVHLADGDRLILDDGSEIAVTAEPEEVMEVEARDAVHLAELAWHIGNRHLAAQIEEKRLLLLRDHVIRDMLAGLGARVRDVVEPFQPVFGAYAGHAHGHHHEHEHGHHDHHHDHGHHGHGERDAFGRLPGDPHYGHNHG